MRAVVRGLDRNGTRLQRLFSFRRFAVAIKTSRACPIVSVLGRSRDIDGTFHGLKKYAQPADMIAMFVSDHDRIEIHTINPDKRQPLDDLSRTQARVHEDIRRFA